MEEEPAGMEKGDSIEGKKIISNKTLLELPKGNIALYIGSGPRVDSVFHLSAVVRTDFYIISDLLFPSEQTFTALDAQVMVTPKNGFDVIQKRAASIGCVLIDQAVLLSPEQWIPAFNALRTGTIIIMHTIHPDHSFFQSAFQTRMGLAPYQGQKGVLIKTGNVSEEDFEIANMIQSWGQHEIHGIGILRRNDQMSLTDSMRRARACKYLLGDFGGRKMTWEAYTNLPPEKKKEIDNETKSEPLEKLLAKLNRPAPPAEYDFEAMTVDANNLAKAISSILSKLLPVERTELIQIFRQTFNEIEACPDKLNLLMVQQIFGVLISQLSDKEQ